MGLTPLSIAIDLDQIYCFGAKGDQRLSWVDTVEKLQRFSTGKNICVVTIFKIPYTGREPKLTISSDRATGELTY